MVGYHYIYAINDQRISDYKSFQQCVQDLQQSSHKQCKFTLVVDENDRPSMSENGTPQIYFDQMNVIHAHL